MCLSRILQIWCMGKDEIHMGRHEKSFRNINKQKGTKNDSLDEKGKSGTACEVFNILSWSLGIILARWRGTS